MRLVGRRSAGLALVLVFSVAAVAAAPGSLNARPLQASASPDALKRSVAVAAANAPRAVFEANRGQVNSQVRFLSRGHGSTLFLTATEAVYVLPLPDPHRLFALRMQLVGSDPNASSTGEAQAEARVSYFRGTEANWVTGIPTYERVRYSEVYPGISMVWRGREQGAAQYDFVVAPNADAGQIGLQFAGADRLELDADGNLLIHTAAGTVTHTKPVSYQEVNGSRRAVESAFTIAGDTVGFAVGAYDHGKPLTIDPTPNLANLAYSTFLGGEGLDIGYAIAVDALGSAYVTGQTDSLNFPTVAGSFDTTSAGVAAFVTKLKPGGNDLVYSTYLDGPADYEQATGIAVDSAGNAYVNGFTASSDFPVTGSAFDPSHNGGGYDAFLTKLNPSGTSLLYSTFLGGSNTEQGNGVAVDSAGNAYLTGVTVSADYPTTGSAFATTLNGFDYDAFFSKINTSASGGASLVYSTFLGGSNYEEGTRVAVDSAGRAYLTGRTYSSDFPTVAGSFDTILSGTSDVFASKLDPALAGPGSLVYSTYLGGSSDEYFPGIAIDANGFAYLTGATASADYPFTAGAYDTTHNGGFNDVFVSKLTANGSALTYSTFIGGSSLDSGWGIAVDSLGNAYVTGTTSSAGYPTTAGAFQTTANGSSPEAFATKLNSTGSALSYSTFLGGGGTEQGYGIAVDSSGNMYVTGYTSPGSPPPFPTTALAFQPGFGGSCCDGFVTKFGNYSISGRAIDSGTGNGVPSVMVAMSGVTANSMLTGADGRFGFTNTVNQTQYTVAASKANMNINPKSFDIASLDGNRDLIFITQFGPPSAVQVRSFTARRSTTGVTLRWRTGAQARVLGFNVYREAQGQRQRLNRTLIPVGAPGHAYARRDPAGRIGMRYRLQVVHVDGSRAWAGVVRVT